jgi:hypothetical protein
MKVKIEAVQAELAGFSTTAVMFCVTNEGIW